MPRIVYLTAGGAGMFCGSCMSDNTLAAALQRLGTDALLVPLYTPIRTDQPDVAIERVFFGGLSVYFEQFWWYRNLPGLAWLAEKLLDQPWLIHWATGLGIETNASQLGELAVSMLRGEEGNQAREVEKLCRWLRDEVRPDLVDLSNLLIAGCVPALKRELGVPVVVTLQGDDIFLDDLAEPYRGQALAEMRRLGEQVDAFVVHSRYYADHMAATIGLPREKMRLARLGIDVRDLAEQAAAEETEGQAGERPLTIGYLARMAPEKGLHVLAEAFVRLARRPGMERVRLHLAGWRGERQQPYLNEQLDKLRAAGLAERVRDFGSVERRGKLDFLRGLDVLSVPTVYRDPKGLFALEALAAGAPVVLPDHGALPELLAATGGGRLHRPGDAEHLADVLEELLRDEAARRQLGAAGRTAVHRDRTAEQMAAEVLAVYGELLGVGR